MIDPLWRAIMPFTTALLTLNAPSRLVAISASQSASLKVSNGARRWMPALLTRMSIGAVPVSAAAIAKSTDCVSVTSITASVIEWPAARSLSAAAFRSSALRPPIVTRAPALASASAQATAGAGDEGMLAFEAEQLAEIVGRMQFAPSSIAIYRRQSKARSALGKRQRQRAAWLDEMEGACRPGGLAD